MKSMFYLNIRSYPGNFSSSLPGRNLSRIIFVLICSVILFACKKDKPRQDDYKDHFLRINFSSATIPYQSVDSAYVLIKKQGSNLPAMKRFDPNNGSLEVVINDFKPAEYTAEIFMFGKMGNGDNNRRQYVQTKAYTLTPAGNDVIVTAPDGTIRDDWKPRVILSDAAREVEVFVPLDNADPYFEMRLKNRTWTKFMIERLASNRNEIGNELIAEGKWECSNDCYTHDNWILNHTAFAAFSGKVATKTWNNGEISVQVEGPGKEQTFFFVYNTTP
jgi:hypothetical protein